MQHPVNTRLEKAEQPKQQSTETWWRLGIWMWGAVTLLLFTPDRVLDRFNLLAWMDPMLPFLALAFVVLSAVFMSETLTDLGQALLHGIRRRVTTERIRERLTVLDHQERAILREFFIQRRSTIALPADEPAVHGLEEVNILRQTRSIDAFTPDGYLHYQIHPWARPMLTARTLNLPLGEMNEGQIQYLKATRPDFVVRELRIRRRRAAA